MLRKFWLSLLALRELGIRRVILYGIYRIGLMTGYFRWRTPIVKQERISKPLNFQPVFSLPERSELTRLLGDQLHGLIQEADEILDQQVRLFGGDPVPLRLDPAGADKHWTNSEPLGQRRQNHLGTGPLRWALPWDAPISPPGRAVLGCLWSYWEVFTLSNPFIVGQTGSWAGSSVAVDRNLMPPGIFNSDAFQPCGSTICSRRLSITHPAYPRR